jgi:hypothetical protein
MLERSARVSAGLTLDTSDLKLSLHFIASTNGLNL